MCPTYLHDVCLLVLILILSLHFVIFMNFNEILWKFEENMWILWKCLVQKRVTGLLLKHSLTLFKNLIRTVEKCSAWHVYYQSVVYKFYELKIVQKCKNDDFENFKKVAKMSKNGHFCDFSNFTPNLARVPRLLYRVWKHKFIEVIGNLRKSKIKNIRKLTSIKW